MSAPLPQVQRWRLLPGQKLPRGSVPLGVSRVEPLGGEWLDGDALWFSPSSVDPEVPTALADALPDPESVHGTIVVGPLATEGGFLSRVLGREKLVARAVRGSALLLRGFQRIGGGVDPNSGLDLCWASAD